MAANTRRLNCRVYAFRVTAESPMAFNFSFNLSALISAYNHVHCPADVSGAAPVGRETAHGITLSAIQDQSYRQRVSPLMYSMIVLTGCVIYLQRPV